MRGRKRCLFTWLALAGVVMTAGATATVAEPGVAETFAEPVRGGIDPAEARTAQLELHSWLVSEMPEGALDAPLGIEVTPADLAELERVDAMDPGKTVVGLTRPVGIAIDLAPVGRGNGPQAGRMDVGSFQPTADGGFVWATTVTSPGANAVRVHFGNLDLPASADLFVYTLAGQAFGPYRSGDAELGDFWAHSVLGDSVIVQLRQYGPASPTDLKQLSFTIDDLGHIGPKFYPAAVDETTRAFCGYNESCIENAECGGPGWSGKGDAQDSTALMLWVAGAFINTCTGTLLNDTDGGTQIPYFLTANHCLRRGRDARNLETYWGYTTSCGGGCPPQWSGGGTQRVGASMVKTGSSGDYTLLELNNAPPSGAVFAGWTSEAVANTNNASLYRIHHPNTAPQGYSTHSVDTGAGTCSGTPRGEFIYSHDEYGATEGGSSGAGVYNSNGQIVGQLFGACGFNPGDPCDVNANSTVDGAFAFYYNSISQYLDPGTSCTPSAEVCDNGSDDDCDGDVDCADSDCSGASNCQGGCTLGQPGDSCSSNGDCCSNKCKGPPSNRTCR